MNATARPAESDPVLPSPMRPAKPARFVNLARAAQVMAERGLDAMVATTHKNVYYLSGHMPDSVYGDFADLNAAAILPASAAAAPALVASDYDLAYLVTHPTWMPELRMYGARARSSAAFLLEMLSRGIGIETELRGPLRQLYGDTRATCADDVITAIAGYIRDGLPEGPLRIGFDDLRVGGQVRALIGDRIDVVDALHDFRAARMVKTPDEIELLRHAARINDIAVQDAAAAAAAGKPMYAMVDAYRMSMVRQGGTFMGQRGMLFGAGPDGGFVLDNDYAEARILASGDVIVFDCIGKYKLYHCDIARTGVVGNPPARLIEIHAVIKEALAAAEAALRPGVHTNDSKEAAAAVLARAGLNRDLTTLAWHHVGLDVVEYAHPSDRVKGWIAEPGMVMNLEIFHRDPDLGGIHLEDSVLVSERGLEHFSRLKREILIAGTPREAEEMAHGAVSGPGV